MALFRYPLDLFIRILVKLQIILTLLFKSKFSHWFFIAFILVSFAILSCAESDEKKEETKRLSYKNCDFTDIKTGDIVLKRGKGRVSKMITDYLKEKVPISHCGIIIVSPDSTYIVHSVAQGYARKDGVQTILLKDFLLDCQAHYFYIVRQKKADAEREVFANKAIEFSMTNTPFDDEANNTDKKEMSCTELIYWCQKDTYGKSDLTTINFANKDLFVFNALLDSTNYNIIKHY